MRGFDAIEDPARRERVKRLHERAPFADIHVHVAMTPYLCAKRMWYEDEPPRPVRTLMTAGVLPLGLVPRADFKRLKTGGVGAVFIAEHIPEPQIFRDSRLARLAAKFAPAYTGKNKNVTLWERLKQMTGLVEEAVRERPDQFVVARSGKELAEVAGKGRTVVVHTLEGLHPVLEGTEGLDQAGTEKHIEERIEWLRVQGYASIVLTHFYHNELCSPNDSITKPMHRVGNFKTRAYEEPLLSPLGKFVIRTIRKAGMMVDMMHLSRKSRELVLAELGAGEPIIATHTAVCMPGQTDQLIEHNLNHDDIRRIADSGGLIGVTFFPYWLQSDPKDVSVRLAIEAMQEIHKVTGSWDSVAIGTDLDGFIDTFDEVRDSADMPLFTDALLQQLGLDDEAALKILGGNAIRVFSRGWRPTG